MMFKNISLKQNFSSGLLVSFIALPLCIAISLASGFPIISGIITAIIGGMLVSQINGSNIAINGPAAGMIVVILDSVESLGNGDQSLGCRYTLAAIICAGIFQIVISFTKLPELIRKFPENIIRGMMMAIGIVVLLKQIFIIFGFATPKVKLIALFLYLKQAFLGMQIATFAIAIFTIILLILWKKIIDKKAKTSWMNKIPIYLIAIAAGSFLAHIFDIDNNHFYLQASFASPIKSNFVNIPNSIDNFFIFPNFDKLFSYQFAVHAFAIFAIGSLETILSAIAIDKIDPEQRLTNLKKDLRAIGFGNSICGSVGALPMIAEIVRSVANAKYGATNKWSNFFHGFCLLLMITIFGSFLKFIPLCVLAAMLVIISLNLINAKLFYQICSKKKTDCAVILCVIFFTLYFDLLIGILTGLLFNLIINFWNKIK